MKRRFAIAAIIAGLLAVLTPGSVPRRAVAQETITLRIATLAPRGSHWDRAFRAWGNSLQQDTNNRLRLRFYLGGSQGDERDYIRKMNAGQLDGAAITTTGLGQIVRPVLVLSAPGLLREYAQIDRVRSRLGNEFKRQFDEAGYHFEGWGDVGQARIFSRRAINRPQDLRSVRPWAWREDPIFTEFLRVVGANPQRLGVNEVLPALQTRRIDAFPSSAYAAVNLQWYNHITHVTQQASGTIVGATIIKKEKYDALPPELQQALDSTAERAHRALVRAIRRADERAYQAIISRGVTAVDITPHQADWDRASRTTRNNLAGRLYPLALLQQVERISGGR